MYLGYIPKVFVKKGIIFNLPYQKCQVKMRTILHLDLDSFFVSVERVLNPSLNGKPVIVGANPHDERGVVAACSYEAREHGLHSAMPISRAYELCPNGIYLTGHSEEYSLFSRAVKRLLRRYAPQLEQASVDEFYMDFTGTGKIYGSIFAFAKKLQEELERSLGLPSSIGIGANKTIAKIASEYAKPRGVTYVIPGMEAEFLAPLPVEVIPGVGKVMKGKLNGRGFKTVGDVAAASAEYFSSAFGKLGLSLYEKALGKGEEYLSVVAPQKSISKEKTFLRDEADIRKIAKTLLALTGKVCQQLRNYGWTTSKVGIKLRYSDFLTVTREKKIAPSDDDRFIYETALALLRKAYSRRVSVRLVGIKLTGFAEYVEELPMFPDVTQLRRRLFRAISKIRNKYGYDAIEFAVLKEEDK